MKVKYSHYSRPLIATVFSVFILSLAACDTPQTPPNSKSAVANTDHLDSPETPASSKATSSTANEVDDIPEYERSSKEDTLNSSANDIVEAIGFAEAQTPDENSSEQGQPHSDDKPELYKKSCNVFGTNDSPQNTVNTQFCDKISSRLASVTLKACMAAKLSPSGCQSVKGVPLMVREFPPLENKPNLGRVLVIGGIHGDELTSVSLTFRWIQTLNKHHSGLFHWHVIPVMNPDGLLKRGAERTNENGVDLNRNLPSDDWEQNAIHYWETKGGKNPRKFPGESPNSEPETQWLVDEVNLFKPDAIIAIHAPYGVVDFDAHKLNTAPKSLGKLRLNLLGTYPGSLGNYAGMNLNIPVITLELPHAWEMPSEKESTLIWEDIVQWLKSNLNATDNSSLVEPSE